MSQSSGMRGTIQFRYHHENGQWWAESDQVRWVGACASLPELRQRTAEGIRFTLSDEGEIDPPARSVFFFQVHPTPWVKADPEAVEAFVLEEVA